MGWKYLLSEGRCYSQLFKDMGRIYWQLLKKLNTVLRPQGIEGIHLTGELVTLLINGTHICGCLAVKY